MRRANNFKSIVTNIVTAVFWTTAVIFLDNRPAEKSYWPRQLPFFWTVKSSLCRWKFLRN